MSQRPGFQPTGVQLNGAAGGNSLRGLQGSVGATGTANIGSNTQASAGVQRDGQIFGPHGVTTGHVGVTHATSQNTYVHGGASQGLGRNASAAGSSFTVGFGARF